MTHELVHAFDYCRSQFDMGSCRQRACSEVRAANLSGECRWTREVMRGNWSVKAQHRVRRRCAGTHGICSSVQACVKRRAKLSLLAATDACQDPSAIDATIEAVWDSCYNDTEPFIDVP